MLYVENPISADEEMVVTIKYSIEPACFFYGIGELFVKPYYLPIHLVWICCCVSIYLIYMFKCYTLYLV